jgi:hypothetical protein
MSNNQSDDETAADSEQESEQQPADSDQSSAQSDEQPTEQTDQSTEQSESGDGTCWATVATMMMSSWHDQTSYTINTAMGRAGSQYQTMVKNDQGLLGRDKPAFLAAAGLQSEAPQDYTVEGMAELIQKYGPLWGYDRRIARPKLRYSCSYRHEHVRRWND